MFCVEKLNERLNHNKKYIALIVMVSFLNACLTGGGGSKPLVRDDCHQENETAKTETKQVETSQNTTQPTDAQAGQDTAKQTETTDSVAKPQKVATASKKVNKKKGVCGPQGFIEITENYSTNDEVKQEFDQAVALLNEEKYKEAIKLLKSVTGKATKFSGPHINLGIAYTRIGEWKNAEASLQKALKLNKNHPVANNELGLVYRKTGRYKEARKSYEYLLNRYPDFLPARKNLGVLCDIYIQDLKCALNQYETYLKANPEDKKVKIWVADVKKRMR